MRPPRRIEAPARPERPLPKRIVRASLLILLTGAAAALAQPADLESWEVARSAHFTIFTDAGAERAVELAGRLERFRLLFERLAPELELDAGERIRIFAFRDGLSYAPYRTVAERGEVRVLGQFLSHPDGSDITLDAARGLGDALGVVYHEYAHHLVRRNLPGVPLWFNEGLAEYYSTFSAGDEAVYLGAPVGRHLAWLRGGGRFSLVETLAATRQEAARHDAEEVGQLYAVSWSLVHYLLSGGDRGARQMADLLALLVSGLDAESAIERAVGLPVSELEQVLRRYVTAGDLGQSAIPLAAADAAAELSVGPAPPAELLTALGDLLGRMGRLEEAERHLHLALDHDPFFAPALSGLAYVHDRQRRWADAEARYREALEHGAADALTLLRYGRHLISPDRPRDAAGAGAPEASAEQARGVLAAAAELEPGRAEIWALLGQAHLLPGGDPEAGIEALQRARERLPDRPDVLFHLLQHRLLRGETEAAGALVGELERREAAELAARAREDVERTALLVAAREAFARGAAEEGLELLDQAIALTSDPGVRSRLAAERRRLGPG